MKTFERLGGLWFLLAALVSGWPVLQTPAAYASDLPGLEVPAAVCPECAGKNSRDLVSLSWAVSGKQDYALLDRIFQGMRETYEQPAMAQHSSLKDFPPRNRMEEFRIMNDVGVVYFVVGEAYRNRGMCEEAIKVLEEVIATYPYAQAWDPSRGDYWSVAEKAGEIINECKRIDMPEETETAKGVRSVPALSIPGTDDVIDYEKYGTFSGIGTSEYKYQMNNLTDLARAAGEGIYPNTADVYKNPRLSQLYREKRLDGTHWDHVITVDLEAAYFKWATASENPGVKLFYTGLIFERAKMYLQAIKAYHALVVHFPTSQGVTYWHTPWYPAQAAVAKITNILRQHPELGLVYRKGRVKILNSTDNNMENDQFFITPGKIEKMTGAALPEKKKYRVKRVRGGRKVNFVQFADGRWQMMVDGKPFMIKGITYAPTKIGQSPDKGTLESWMYADNNGNGLADGPYDSWVDRNFNGLQDADEPVVGDFQLMKEMGTNVIRVYHNDNRINKELLRDMHDKYGIHVIMGDFLGKYTLGSGAEWTEGTDYENPEHRANMLKSVEAMVREYKDEPFLLMWILGNENNYGVACNADKKPEVYYRFVNEVAKRIKQLDPKHPVSLCNGDVLYLSEFSRFAPEVDAFGANVYRGDYGFGAFWEDVRSLADRPAFITEYGSPAFSRLVPQAEAEEEQAAYHRGNWMDIEANSAAIDGAGNSVGGILFSWTDEWWKNYDPYRHDTKANAKGPFAGGYYYEEWFGITGQGEGQHSPFLRELRPAYFAYRQMWNEKR